MNITVSQFIVDYMERLGIEYVFGIPGAHILPVFDALYDSKIKCILSKHEQGAAFMAGAYTRVSGKISACVTTAGPGATNLVTGIANAYVDKLPVLIITGEAPTYLFGKGGLQESSGEGSAIDQKQLFKGITRYNKVIERIDYLRQVFNFSTKILFSHNSGPVLISFPYNIQQQPVEQELLSNIITDKYVSTKYDGIIPVDNVVELIAESRNPVIIAGYGCIQSQGQDIFADFYRNLNIPVATSIKGRGVIPETSPLALGSLGVTSDGVAYNYIVNNADLLIFLGVGFNERTSYLWDEKLLKNKKVIQIDVNYEQLEKVFQADIALHGDVKKVIALINDKIKQEPIKAKSFDPAIIQEIRQNNHNEKSVFSLFRDKFSVVEQFFQRLEQEFSDNVVLFDDNIIFAQNFYHVLNNNSYFPNSGVSSLGHAVPAAIGAKLAHDKPTFAIIGDGGFQMCCMEIMTAVNYQIPLTIIVFNNSTMGLIRKNQYQHYNKRFIGCDFVNPDYGLLAKSFNIAYQKIVSLADIDPTFKEMDFQRSINLIEIELDKDAFPDYISKR